MSPSRPFIVRPVATSLLMVAILLIGIVAYQFLPLVGIAGGRLSDHPGPDLLSGCQPRCDDLVGHRTAGAPVGRDAEPEADVVDEFGRGLGHHPAIQPRHQPRHRRAGSPGGDQRRRQPPAVRSSGAADLCQGQSGRRADPDPGADLQDAAACRRSRTSPTRVWRRRSPSSPASAWSASAAASVPPCGSRPTSARSPPTASTSTICAPRSATPTSIRRRAISTALARLHHQRQRSARGRGRLSQPRHRLQERRAGAALRRGRGRRQRGEHASSAPG